MKISKESQEGNEAIQRAQLNLNGFNEMHFIFISGWFITLIPEQVLLPQGPNIEQADETYHHRFPEGKLAYGKGLVRAQSIYIITNDNKWKKWELTRKLLLKD